MAPELKKPVKRNSGKKSLTESFSSIASAIMGFYVLIMLTVFPLYTHDKYFDILESRFSFFWHFTLGIVIVMGLVGIFFLVSDWVLEEGEFIKSFRPKFYITDIPITVFTVIGIISMLFSGYIYECWWGNEGRYLGAFFWLLVFFTYFLISRFYRFNIWHLRAFMLVGAFISYWGITDFFLKDIFGFFEGVGWEHKTTFAASIGNINSFTSFSVILLGVSFFLFMKEKRLFWLILDFIILLLSILAGITGRSDSAFLSYTLVYTIILFLCVNNKDTLFRFLLAFSVLLTSMRVISLIACSEIVTVSVSNISSIMMKIGALSLLTPITVVFWILTLLCALNSFILRDFQKPFSKKALGIFRKTGLVILILVFILFVIAFIDANSGWHTEFWQDHSNIFVIDYSWGTGRGFVWNVSMDYFLNEISFLKKLIGTGPESFYMFTMDNYYSEMLHLGYGMYDSAHNEYLNILLTLGILGLFSYLCFFFLSIREIVKSIVSNPGENGNFRLAIALGVVAYLVQAFLNVAVCIVLPIMLTLLYTALAASRANNKEYMVDNPKFADKLKIKIS